MSWPLFGSVGSCRAVTRKVKSTLPYFSPAYSLIPRPHNGPAGGGAADRCGLRYGVIWPRRVLVNVVAEHFRKTGDEARLRHSVVDNS